MTQCPGRPGPRSPFAPGPRPKSPGSTASPPAASAETAAAHRLHRIASGRAGGHNGPQVVSFAAAPESPPGPAVAPSAGRDRGSGE